MRPLPSEEATTSPTGVLDDSVTPNSNGPSCLTGRRALIRRQSLGGPLLRSPNRDPDWRTDETNEDIPDQWWIRLTRDIFPNSDSQDSTRAFV